MKIYSENSLRKFDFWGGAQLNASELTNDQLDEVEELLSNMYPDGIDETLLNDIFRFDFDTVREWLGLPVEEGLYC